jgi:hypothetical protein
MHVGDKVRMLHSKGQGVIKKIQNNGIVEVEIEDGFVIPVSIRELVLVAKEENSFFEDEKAIPSNRESAFIPKREIKSSHGIYLAFVPKNDRELDCQLINNTDYRLIYALFEKRGIEETGLAHGILEPKSAIKSTSYFLEGFENWPEFIVEAIYYSSESKNRPSTLRKNLKAKANNFFKMKAIAPVIKQEAHLYQLDAEHVEVPIQELKEALSGDGHKITSKDNQRKAVPDTVIDLHIESLVPQAHLLGNQDMLQIQLEAFEKALDGAIFHNMNEITFVHGVGNGTLRHEIHKRLSRLAPRLTFKDAQREKFGYGATLVKLLG